MNTKQGKNFLAPKFLTMPSYALDISDESIKYGKLVPAGKRLKLVNYGQETIPSGIVVSGVIQNDEKLVEILNKMRIREKMTFVRVALPEEQMYLFDITLPALPLSQIHEAISLQIEEHIPLSAAEAVFDFDVINTNGSNVTVQVSATSIDLIESYLSLFERAHLVPVSFEIEAQAIARAVIPEDSKETIMIVDFGQTRTGISIASEGRVLFTSTFNMGGKDITDVISKNFNISFEEAEKKKRLYGREQSIDNDVFPVVINSISVLRDELNKHFTYWHTHEPENGQKHQKIAKIILCGGNANFAGIAHYLEVSMKVPVEYANTWVNVLDVVKDVPAMSFKDSLSYSTVVGLALADFIKK